MTRCWSRSGRSRWAPAPPRAECSPTTRSCKARTSSCRSTSTSPGARHGPRRCSTASTSCSARSWATRTPAGGRGTAPTARRNGRAEARRASRRRRSSRHTARQGSWLVPDAPGLELIRADINERHPDAVLGTSFDRQQAALLVDPEQVLAVLGWLRDTPGQEYRFLSSLHAADYLPSEPRFGVHYELLCRDRVERLRLK